jgi:polysaccharide chain length determinant protein (PEP-CTERM system associated)
MTQDTTTVSDYVQVLRKRIRPALLAAFGVFLAMTAFVFLSPTVYESSAKLLIEQMDMPVELTGGVGAQEYVEQRLQRTRQRVLTDTNAKALIDRYKLYESTFGEGLLEEKLDEFNANVLITPQVTGVIDPKSMRAADLTYAFDVAFRDSNPETSQKVAAELASLFVSSSAAQAKEEAEREIAFASAESDRIAAELREREGRLAKFRQAHPSGLPDDRVRNQERAMAFERELATVDSDLRAARARQELYTAQLRDTPRDSPVLDETGQVVLRGQDRLAVAQQELMAARSKYSEDHPDVRRLKREIASLTAEASAGQSAQPTNPAYIQLQSQVNAAAIEVRELSVRRSQLSRDLTEIEGAISVSPQIEEQYADLVRDYEVIKAQYEQLRSQQATAELKRKAADSAAETYVLINPARVPEDPVEPDRVALMFLGIVLSIAAGLGTAFLLNAADPTVRGRLDVIALAGAEPFAQIPAIRTQFEARKRRVGNLALAAGMAALAFLLLLVVA